MDALSDWNGSLTGMPRAEATETLVSVVDEADSGAAAFLGLTKSKRSYWMKAINNPQGADTLVAERVVSALGLDLGSPVRPVALVHIPEELVGWRFSE